MTSMNQVTTDKNDMVRLIIEDLLSAYPSYDYELGAISEHYVRPLEILIKARKHQGQIAAQRTFETLEPLLGMSIPTHQQPKPDTHNGTHAHITTTENSVPPLPEGIRLQTGLLPQVSRWLHSYVQYSRQVSPEGYEDFHLACGLWVASTIAARRIYVPLAEPVYTPLYIALVARTTFFAKTTTARVGIRLLKAANLDWLLGGDETTPQKLLADMAGHIPSNYAEMTAEQQIRIARRLSLSGQRGWFYDEFNQLVDAMTRPGPMADFASILRKLENCPDSYVYSTRSNGEEIIDKPYLAFLASTTPANLKRHAGKHNTFWNDGLWARFVFLTPSADTFTTATMQIGEVSIPEGLCEQLQAWHQRLGVPSCTITEILKEDKPTGRYTFERTELPRTPIPIDEEAYQAYSNYRNALREITANGHHQDLDGSYARLPQIALRIAALLASLEAIDRITLPFWSVAQEIAEMFRKNLHELYQQVASSFEDDEEKSLGNLLIDFLKNQSEMKTVRDIIQRAPVDIRRLKTEGLRSLLVSFERDGLTTAKREGRKEVWGLTPKGMAS